MNPNLLYNLQPLTSDQKAQKAMAKKNENSLENIGYSWTILLWFYASSYINLVQLGTLVSVTAYIINPKFFEHLMMHLPRKEEFENFADLTVAKGQEVWSKMPEQEEVEDFISSAISKYYELASRFESLRSDARSTKDISSHARLMKILKGHAEVPSLKDSVSLRRATASDNTRKW